MVEGLALVEEEANDVIDRVKHIACRNSDNRYAGTREPCITGRVPPGIITHLMRHAVDLNPFERRLAIEIQHIGASGVLATEFEAAGAGAEGAPQ
jgi:hypothetical protein